MSPAVKLGDGVLDSLRATTPPARLLHVGVGAGIGPMQAWRNWPVQTAWLIDADPARRDTLDALAAQHPQWQVRIATLAEREGISDFHQASNPAESGLIDPSALAALWPNLRQTGVASHRTVTLDSLAGGSELDDRARHDWLLVDCLTSLAILRGAPRTLDRCGVLWLRTLLAPLADQESGAGATTLGQLQALLEPLGFQCVHLEECNHPAVVEAIFVRMSAPGQSPDTPAQPELVDSGAGMAPLEEFASASYERAARMAHTEPHVASLPEARLGSLEQELAQALQQIADLQQAAAAAVVREHELSAEHMAALEDIKVLQAALEARKLEHASQAALLEQKELMLRQRDEEIAKLAQRQGQMQEELVRAEAQIDLIANVLLREPGL